MTIDHNVCDAARALDQERPIGPAEAALLDTMEQHDDSYADWRRTNSLLAEQFAMVLAAWLYPGAEINMHDRSKGKPRCLAQVRVVDGNARGATVFRIAAAPTVTVADNGSPETSVWRCKAHPLSPKTGQPMSGRTSNSVRSDDTVTLGGPVFWAMSDTSWARDQFLDMARRAELILLERAP